MRRFEVCTPLLCRACRARAGGGPNFNAFLLQPKKGKEQQLHNALNGLYGGNAASFEGEDDAMVPGAQGVVRRSDGMRELQRKLDHRAGRAHHQAGAKTPEEAGHRRFASATAISTHIDHLVGKRAVRLHDALAAPLRRRRDHVLDDGDGGDNGDAADDYYQEE